MKLSTSLVSVKKITSKVDSSKFSDEELNKVADLILKLEGVINPLILRKTSIESYEVVDGDFEYYAAAKARELDPRKGEMIGAFIIESNNEEVIHKQVKALRRAAPDTNEHIKHLLQQFESFQEKIELLTNKVEQVDASIKKLIDQKDKKPNLLVAKPEEVSAALKQVKVNKTSADAACKAIEYWKTGEEITWENLEKSTKAGKHKINGFAKGTYEKLKDVADIIS